MGLGGGDWRTAVHVGIWALPSVQEGLVEGGGRI